MRLSICSVSLSVFAFALSATAAARPDLNSFLNRKVSDTGSLISQVRTDNEVADRYQRHFAMNRQEIVAYLSNLRRGELPKDGMYTIYSVPNDGQMRMRVSKIRRGEPMFFDPAGKPVLIAKCGNPVVTGPSRVRRGNPVVVVPTDESSTREYTELTPRESMVENPTELVALVPPVPTVVPPTLVPSTPPVEPSTPVVDNPVTVPATATGGGGSFPWFLGLPLLFPLFGGNGDDGGTAPVPEPATMVVLGLGALAVVRRRRRN